MTESFTLHELEHLMFALNGEAPQSGCSTCISVRKKCEQMIEDEMSKKP